MTFNLQPTSQTNSYPAASSSAAASSSVASAIPFFPSTLLSLSQQFNASMTSVDKSIIPLNYLFAECLTLEKNLVELNKSLEFISNLLSIKKREYTQAVESLNQLITQYLTFINCNSKTQEEKTHYQSLLPDLFKRMKEIREKFETEKESLRAKIQEREKTRCQLSETLAVKKTHLSYQYQTVHSAHTTAQATAIISKPSTSVQQAALLAAAAPSSIQEEPLKETSQKEDSIKMNIESAASSVEPKKVKRKQPPKVLEEEESSEDEIFKPRKAQKNNANQKVSEPIPIPLTDEESTLISTSWNRLTAEIKYLVSTRYQAIYQPNLPQSDLTANIFKAQALASRFNPPNLSKEKRQDVALVNWVDEKEIFPNDVRSVEYLRLLKLLLNHMKALMLANPDVEIKHNQITKINENINGFVTTGRFAGKLLILYKSGSFKTLLAQDGTKHRALFNHLLEGPLFKDAKLPEKLIKFIHEERAELLCRFMVVRDLRAEAYHLQIGDLVTDARYEAFEKIGVDIYRRNLPKSNVRKTLKGMGATLETSHEKVRIISERDSVVFDKKTGKILAIFKKDALTKQAQSITTGVNSIWANYGSKWDDKREKQKTFGKAYELQNSVMMDTTHSTSFPDVYQKVKTIAAAINLQFSLLLPKIHANALAATEPFRNAGYHYSPDNVFSSTGINFNDETKGIPCHMDNNFHNFTAMTVTYIHPDGSMGRAANPSLTRFFEFYDDSTGIKKNIGFALNSGDLLISDTSFIHDAAPAQGEANKDLKRSSIVYYSSDNLVIPAVLPRFDVETETPAASSAAAAMNLDESSSSYAAAAYSFAAAPPMMMSFN